MRTTALSDPLPPGVRRAEFEVGYYTYTPPLRRTVLDSVVLIMFTSIGNMYIV
jgi:hypothetical protein